MELMSFLEPQFEGPPFDHGFAERYLSFVLEPNGGVTVRPHAPRDG